MTTRTPRRALAASEWTRIQKDAATSASLDGGGKAPPATAKPSEPERDPKVKLPPVEEAKPEEITLPRTKACEHVEVEKCGCGGAPQVKAAPEEEAKKAEVSLQTDAPPDKTVEPAPEKRSVMLAFWLPAGIAKGLTVDGGTPADEMHLTLGYFGKVGTDITDEQVEMLHKCASAVGKAANPMKGILSGVGRFSASSTSDGKDVVYASVDVPGLSKFRHQLVDEIAKCSGIVKSEIHDYTPHVTLKYVGEDEATPVAKLARQEITFTHMVLAVGKERRLINLGEVEQPTTKCVDFIEVSKADADERRVTGVVLQPEVVDAQGDIYSAQVIKDAAHAFLAQYNERNKLGVQHSVKAGSPVSMFPKGLYLVESYVTPVEMVINGKVVKKGSWLMTVFVEDDEIWAKVKSGGIRGFSIGGVAKVQKLTPVAAAA